MQRHLRDEIGQAAREPGTRAALEDQILNAVRDVVGVGDTIHFGVDAVGGVHDRRPSAVASALGQLLLVVDTDGSRRDHPLAIDWHRIAPPPSRI